MGTTRAATGGARCASCASFGVATAVTEHETIWKKPRLIIDPCVQFGDVCIEGTRTPAAVIAGCVFAGDGVAATAKAYGITREEVLLCCAWRTFDAARISPSRRNRHERAMVERWEKWATQAYLALAGWPTVPAPNDPPRKGEV